VAVLSCALVDMAGTSLAATGEVDPDTVTAVSTGSAVGGVAVGTLMWALVGVGLLVLGFIATSRSSSADVAVGGPSLLPVGAAPTFEPPAAEAQGDATSSAVTV
jgi:hypothetical protein